MSLPTETETEADLLDREIGARLRQARKARGLTQGELGGAIGVSFQQVQKYERGLNRVSSSALILFGRALDLSPASLLGEGEQDGAGRIDWNLFGVSGSDELLRAYAAIDSAPLRRIVLDLCRRLAET